MRNHMRTAIIATLILAAGIAAAKLNNGYGQRVTVNTAISRVTFPGDAERVKLVNSSGGIVYYAYNCTTSQWATILAATNAMVLEASEQADLHPESGPYFSVCMQCVVATSTVSVTAQ